MSLHRRAFLKTAASAAAALTVPRLVYATGAGSMRPSQNNLVGVLIDTDRDRLLEQLVARIRAGLDYRALLGAVAEAAAREVRPYPYVGFKYHAFMVLHAVHRTTLQIHPEDRWLPILWSADVFKASQAAEEKQGGWALRPVSEHQLPPTGRMEDTFRRAMEQWDPEAADAAIVSLMRTQPQDRVFELLFRFGARDFRSIGHKAITVANCHRLLRVVGANQAEPMLRSVVFALQNHGDEPNPATSDLVPDRPWRRNLVLLRESRSNANGGKSSDGQYVAELLQTLREGSDQDASLAMLSGIHRGVPSDDLWTAVFVAAGDLMLKQSGIVSVHANTTSNALHYAYRHVSGPETRRILLLQAASFLPLFRDMLGTDRRGLGIDTLKGAENVPTARDSLEEIFADISGDRLEAARKTLGYLRSGGLEEPFKMLARHYTVDRNVGYHDYKFTESAFENAMAMGSPWHERYLAVSTLYLNGSADKPNATVERARALLGPPPKVG